MLRITLHYRIRGRSDLTTVVNRVYTLRRSLEGRYARAIIVGKNARDEDEDADIPEDIRGFRTAAAFGEMLGKVPGGRGTVRPVGVKASIFEVRAILRGEPRRGETGQLLPPDDLFETRRGKGYRLQVGAEIEVVMHPDDQHIRS